MDANEVKAFRRLATATGLSVPELWAAIRIAAYYSNPHHMIEHMNMVSPPAAADLPGGARTQP
jgi:hypothetical protein